MYYKFSCPVPKDQRPINEYIELGQSNFYNWPFLTPSLYNKKITQVFFTCFIISLPFSSLFFNITYSPLKFALINFFVSTIIILALLIRIFLGWNYIKQRLYNPTIFYEESGWYDGRVWVKSKNILVQDRLIHAYQVVPAIKNIIKTILLFSYFLLTVLLLIILI